MPTPSGPYIARRRVFIPNAPGKQPAIYRFDRGVVFSLDGDERVDPAKLLVSHAIANYTGDLAQLEPIEGVPK